jgi:DNA repair protein RadC
MKITSTLKAEHIFRKKIRFDIEELWIAALNSQLEVIEIEMLFRGTATHCPCHPRDIVRFICEKNSCFFILAHSHPSGSPDPSAEDLKITRQILKIGQLVEIPLLDHLILTRDRAVSLSSRKFFRKLGPAIQT